MSIRKAYLRWMDTWLRGRRAYIEIVDQKSRWFSSLKGCRQGSVLSPTLFITCHAAISESLDFYLSYFFANDLAAVLAGSIGMKCFTQCLDLEKKVKLVLENLHFYSTVTSQPITFPEIVDR